MILSCNNISKAFITDQILNNVSFQVLEKEKVALVGINGAGKSTLFKIMIGELHQDSGEVILSNSANLAYLAQNAFLDSEKTIYEEILSSKESIIQMEQGLRDLEKQIAQNANNSEILTDLSEKYTALSHEFELLDGYSYRSRVKGVIRGLGFLESEFDRAVSVLSGGQKTRLALAKLLVTQPELLLLDEPTNHLDMQAIEWLEQYLNAYNGALIIISHDRYFLDHVVSKVIELENGKAKVYHGNYSFFSVHKAIDQEIEEKHYIGQQREIKRQEEIIKELKSFNREKSVKRARSREKNLDKVERIDKPMHLNDTMHFHLKPRISSGNDVLKVRELGKSFGEKTIFQNVDFDVFKGERVALIGGNGTGKTTIFKIITGGISQTKGTIKHGTNVHIGYYDQEQSLLNHSNTLIDEISDTYPDLNTGEIRNLLANFLFTRDDVFKLISTLSGGEKGRLTLAKLMMSNANFLLLDEPTNHLDVISKEVLEKTLSHYTGTLFIISHDRYFINQVATKVLELTPSGIEEYLGNYDYFVEKRQEKAATTDMKNEGQKNNKDLWLQKKEEETKRRKLEKQIEKTEKDIHLAESRINEIDDLLCQEDIYTNHVMASELSDEKATLEHELIDLYGEWELLHADS